MALLSKYGGLWLDATIWVTEKHAKNYVQLWHNMYSSSAEGFERAMVLDDLWNYDHLSSFAIMVKKNDRLINRVWQLHKAMLSCEGISIYYVESRKQFYSLMWYYYPKAILYFPKKNSPYDKNPLYTDFPSLLIIATIKEFLPRWGHQDADFDMDPTLIMDGTASEFFLSKNENLAKWIAIAEAFYIFPRQKQMNDSNELQHKNGIGLLHPYTRLFIYDLLRLVLLLDKYDYDFDVKNGPDPRLQSRKIASWEVLPTWHIEFHQRNAEEKDLISSIRKNIFCNVTIFQKNQHT